MVFKERMRIAGNHRLSQSAQEFFIAVDEFFPFFFVCCDMDRLVAVDCQTFQILRTQTPPMPPPVWLLALMMTDIGRRFSPAGPMTVTEAVGEVS